MARLSSASPNDEVFLENRLRDHFGFEGVPLGIVFRKK